MSFQAVAARPKPQFRPARAALVPLALFCLGHFFVDLYSGALGVLQPLVVFPLIGFFLALKLPRQGAA